MSDSKATAYLGTINKIFSKVDGWQGKQSFVLPNSKVTQKSELELALTVLLVDLADCDQHFDPNEYHIIVEGLHSLFGTGRVEARALINQANLILKNLRGTSRYGSLLKENLTEEERSAIMEIIDSIIESDGQEDGFEVYIRQKIADQLGITAKEVKTEQNKD